MNSSTGTINSLADAVATAESNQARQVEDHLAAHASAIDTLTHAERREREAEQTMIELRAQVARGEKSATIKRLSDASAVMEHARTARQGAAEQLQRIEANPPKSGASAAREVAATMRTSCTWADVIGTNVNAPLPIQPDMLATPTLVLTQTSSGPQNSSGSGYVTCKLRGVYGALPMHRAAPLDELIECLASTGAVAKIRNVKEQTTEENVHLTSFDLLVDWLTPALPTVRYRAEHWTNVAYDLGQALRNSAANHKTLSITVDRVHDSVSDNGERTALATLSVVLAPIEQHIGWAEGGLNARYPTGNGNTFSTLAGPVAKSDCTPAEAAAGLQHAFYANLGRITHVDLQRTEPHGANATRHTVRVTALSIAS